jgi:hypothetical protein
MRKVTTIEEPNEEFIIVNELAQVFYGLKAGLPQFTEDWERAKPLNNVEQFKCVQRGTFDKLEKLKI